MLQIYSQSIQALFLHAAAYVILLGIKQKVFAGRVLVTTSILTVREKILLTAVHIRVLKMRIKIKFPQHHPYRELSETAFIKFVPWREIA